MMKKIFIVLFTAGFTTGVFAQGATPKLAASESNKTQATQQAANKPVPVLSAASSNGNKNTKQATEKNAPKFAVGSANENTTELKKK